MFPEHTDHLQIRKYKTIIMKIIIGKGKYSLFFLTYGSQNSNSERCIVIKGIVGKIYSVAIRLGSICMLFQCFYYICSFFLKSTIVCCILWHHRRGTEVCSVFQIYLITKSPYSLPLHCFFLGGGVESNTYSEAHILVSTGLIECTLCVCLQNECIFTYGSKNNGEKIKWRKKRSN